MNYKNNCMFCKWSKRERTYTFKGENYHGSICKHPNAVIYHKLKTKCECGRFDPLWLWISIIWVCKKIGIFKGKSCGACMGRGDYIYPLIYDQCDCNGWLRDNKSIKKYIKNRIHHIISEKEKNKIGVKLLNELSNFSN